MSEQTEAVETTNGTAEQAYEMKKPREKKSRHEPGHHVLRAINEVKKALNAAGGITKDRDAPKAAGGYQFRGIDDMYNALCGLTADVGLVMIPRVVDHKHEVLPRAEGKYQVHVWLTMEVDFLSEIDGSKHTARVCGEGADTSDKATNKAESAAFKYACLMPFMIPTHGEQIDSETEHVERAAPAKKTPPPPPSEPRQSKLNIPGPAKAEPKCQVVDVTGFVQAVDNARTFKLLLDLSHEVDQIPDPGRSHVFERIFTRTATLIDSQQDVDELKEAKGLVKALGMPKGLQDAYNKRYAELRAAGDGFAG